MVLFCTFCSCQAWNLYSLVRLPSYMLIKSPNSNSPETKTRKKNYLQSKLYQLTCASLISDGGILEGDSSCEGNFEGGIVLQSYLCKCIEITIHNRRDFLSSVDPAHHHSLDQLLHPSLITLINPEKMVTLQALYCQCSLYRLEWVFESVLQSSFSIMSNQVSSTYFCSHPHCEWSHHHCCNLAVVWQMFHLTQICITVHCRPQNHRNTSLSGLILLSSIIVGRP